MFVAMVKFRQILENIFETNFWAYRVCSHKKGFLSHVYLFHFITILCIFLYNSIN